jgi:hypothetical protein
MHRTELCFRALHERLVRLEDRTWQGPSDEQVERVLRKILAERFSAGIAQQDQEDQDPSIMKEEERFVEDRRVLANLKSVHIDPAMLFVHPDTVPSKAYAETMKVLDTRLADFPNIDHNTAVK